MKNLVTYNLFNENFIRDGILKSKPYTTKDLDINKNHQLHIIRKSANEYIKLINNLINSFIDNIIGLYEYIDSSNIKQALIETYEDFLTYNSGNDISVDEVDFKSIFILLFENKLELKDDSTKNLLLNLLHRQMLDKYRLSDEYVKIGEIKKTQLSKQFNKEYDDFKELNIKNGYKDLKIIEVDNYIIFYGKK